MCAAKLVASRSLSAIAVAMVLYGPMAVTATELESNADPTCQCASSESTSDVKEASLGTPVANSALAQERGGAEVDNTNDVLGEVTNNTAHNVATGANTIQGGSFANASGITTVVQNTGANVLIQSATIVNVQFSTP